MAPTGYATDELGGTVAVMADALLKETTVLLASVNAKV
jgi:hypothetical protein